MNIRTQITSSSIIAAAQKIKGANLIIPASRTMAILCHQSHSIGSADDLCSILAGVLFSF